MPTSLGEPVLSPPGPVELLIVITAIVEIAISPRYWRKNFFIKIFLVGKSLEKDVIERSRLSSNADFF